MAYNDLLKTEKPVRYLGSESGAIAKENPLLRFILAFPDVYEVGMSHLGFQILYSILNSHNDIAAERVYSPWPDREKQLRDSGEKLTSLESGTLLSQAGIIGFTLQYELSYSNILNMLDLAGIPFLSYERDETFPLIIGGGPCAYNPEPVADFFDAFLIGDGEEAVIEIARAYMKWKELGGSKNELLESLSLIEGVYIPSFFDVTYQENGRIEKITPLKSGYSKVRKRFLADLDSAPYPQSPVVPLLKTVHDRVSIEICRGCTRGCRFCQAGYVYRPVRERSPETILDLTDSTLKSTGYDEVTLLSLSTGDYTELTPLLTEMMEKHCDDRVAVSLPSLRVGSLSDELIEQIKRVRKTGFTLAPEAGSERLRSIINKGISEENLLMNATSAYNAGWRIIKLYFMIGLPFETDDDVAAIVETSSKVKRCARISGNGGDVNVSVSSFVPKPHTPFQWEAQISYEEILRKQEMLYELLKRKRLRLKRHDAPLSVMEGVFARGDRRLSKVLLAAHRLGCCFDGWSEHFSFHRWLKAFEETGLDPLFYHRQRDFDEILPWDHIDCGVTKNYLLLERKLAGKEEFTPDCRTGRCTGCGVCDFVEIKKRVFNGFSPSLKSERNDSDESTPSRIRIRYTKLGKSRFLSHLELVNLFSRAAIRGALPIRYSQGFHPHPKFSFASPLSVGVESLAEYFDLELNHQIDCEEAKKKINNTLPEGIEIVELYEIPLKAPSLDTTTDFVIYSAEIPMLSPEIIRQKTVEFLALESFVYSRKGKGQEIDLRQNLLDLNCDGNTIIFKVRRGKAFEFVASIAKLSTEDIFDCRIRKIETVFTDQAEDTGKTVS